MFFFMALLCISLFCTILYSVAYVNNLYLLFQYSIFFRFMYLELKEITRRFTDLRAVQSPEDRGFFIQILESVYRFTLGAAAGAVGM